MIRLNSTRNKDCKLHYKNKISKLWGQMIVSDCQKNVYVAVTIVKNVKLWNKSMLSN